MAIRALCPYCDRVSRYSGEWRGRKLRCGNPECGRSFSADHVVEPPLASPVEPPMAMPGEPPRARPVEPAFAKPIAAPFATPIPTQSCPCCGSKIATDAMLCTICGTNLETGRRIIPPKPWNKEEEREELGHGWLRLLSLWAWVAPGPVPYASEVPIRNRPTALIVLVVLCFVCFPLEYVDWLKPYMPLWGGDPSIPRTYPPDYPTDAPRPRLPVGHFHWWQLITYQFMHGDAEHIAFNMVMLLVFGPKVNDLLGKVGFTAAFVGLGAVAGIAHIYQNWGQQPMPLVGASGSAMVVAGMYLVFCPQHRIRMVFWVRVFIFTPVYCVPFRVRGIYLVLLSVALDLIEIFFGSGDNVAHGVHFIGFLSGACIAALLVAMRAVHTGGYDLLSWCFGQQEIQPDFELREPTDDRWSSMSNHPAFMVGFMLAVAVFFFNLLRNIVS